MYSKLRGRIYEKFGSLSAFAAAMGKSVSAISSKLSGRCEWTRSDIELAVKLLDIPVSEIPVYFF